jgi:hypothetical protein
MEFKEINETNVVNNLNTTFDESLKSWVILTYLFSSEEKRFWWVTWDGQYKFTLLKEWDSINDLKFWETKVFWDFLDNDEWKTLKGIIEDSQEWFWYTSIHNQLWGHLLEPKAFEIENINDIDSLLIELKRQYVKWDINDILK